ncbi:WD40 repeat domain-containing protein [Candidatus Dependentiae bacterium]
MKKILILLLALSATTANFAKYYLASGSLFGTIKIWEAKTWKERKTLTDNSTVSSVAFSPDGKYLASGAVKTIKIWDTSDKDPLKWKERKTLTRHIVDPVLSVAFSPDGDYLASGAEDGTITIWDTKTWKEIETEIPLNHNKAVKSVAFSPNGNYLASGSRDKTIKIWDTSDKDPLQWKEIKTLTEHNDWVNSVAFSPDGKYLASGSKAIKIWDISDENPLKWKEEKTLQGHPDWVNSVTFSPDGNYLASGSRDKTIKIWDTSDKDPSQWKEIKTLTEHNDSVHSVAFSPDGNYLASGSKTIKIWDISDDDPLKWTEIKTKTPLKHKDLVSLVRSVAFSPDIETEEEKFQKKLSALRQAQDKKEEPKKRPPFYDIGVTTEGEMVKE